MIGTSSVRTIQKTYRRNRIALAIPRHRREANVVVSSSCGFPCLSAIQLPSPTLRLLYRSFSRALSTASSHFPSATGTSSSPSTVKLQGAKNPIPDFDDVQMAFRSKSTRQLIQGALTFGLCHVPVLVRNAETLLRIARTVLGDRITDSLLKHTFFGHFCAGEDEKGIQPAVQELKKAGIGSILDFAAEDDGSLASSSKSQTTRNSSTITTPHDRITHQIVTSTTAQARVYNYESEIECDRHVKNFRDCIRAVASMKDGFAAIKVTALGNPKLLERMSKAIVEVQNLFAKFDLNGDGLISKEEFEHGFNVLFKDDDVKFRQAMERAISDSNKIDYIAWSMSLTPQDLPKITAGCREVGPLTLATPTDEEIELIQIMYDRGRALAEEAAQHGVRLLIDAEQVRFQPAIDTLVLDLQRMYNARDVSSYPIIYNTYQCYLKDAQTRLIMDVERSERFGYHFGAKLVRGAYMESERALAKKLGYSSPIRDTFTDTHECYNSSFEFLLKHAKKSDMQLEVMLASHNRESIEKAIAVMNEFDIDRYDSTVAFGQLYGMKDNLTFNLGRHGFRAYKYVPYGQVKMVMPYLIRRANENSSVAGGAASELSLIAQELWRRMTGRSVTTAAS